MDIVDIILQAELGNLEAQYVLGNCYMVGNLEIYLGKIKEK